MEFSHKSRLITHRKFEKIGKIMKNVDEKNINEKIIKLTEKVSILENSLIATDKRLKTLLINLKNGYGFYDNEFLEEELPEHPHTKVPEPFDEEEFKRKLHAQIEENPQTDEISNTHSQENNLENLSESTAQKYNLNEIEKEEIIDPTEKRRKKFMSFWEHVEEFRWVIIKSTILLFITISLAFFVTTYIYQFLIQPVNLQVEKGAVKLIYDSPISAFLIQLKMGILGGIIFAMPLIIFFIWRFASPGLKKNEQNAVLFAIFSGSFFFLIGAIFGYSFIPLGLPVLMEFGMKGIEQLWSIDTYIGFTIKLMLAFGILFEMPVILGLLSKLGLITATTLRKHRKISITIIIIVAALLTPPDPISQIALAVPMFFLYELSIWIAKFNEKRSKNEK